MCLNLSLHLVHWLHHKYQLNVTYVLFTFDWWFVANFIDWNNKRARNGKEIKEPHRIHRHIETLFVYLSRSLALIFHSVKIIALYNKNKREWTFIRVLYCIIFILFSIIWSYLISGTKFIWNRSIQLHVRCQLF